MIVIVALIIIGFKTSGKTLVPMPLRQTERQARIKTERQAHIKTECQARIKTD